MRIEDLFGLSYLLQAVGFIGISFAWAKAIHEFRTGKQVYSTRLLLLIITTIAFLAYFFPGFAAICYFIAGCFKPYYRAYLRVFSGIILFLYGAAMFILFYTKDHDIEGGERT